eukprot:1159235-Pelagomonas_calceolata.AAC.8
MKPGSHFAVAVLGMLGIVPKTHNIHSCQLLAMQDHEARDHEARDHEARVTGLAMLKNHMLASISFDRTIRIWDLSNMKPVSVVHNAHDTPIQCIEYAQNVTSLNAWMHRQTGKYEPLDFLELLFMHRPGIIPATLGALVAATYCTEIYSSCTPKT